jgi:hypothetical protein
MALIIDGVNTERSCSRFRHPTPHPSAKLQDHLHSNFFSNDYNRMGYFVRRFVSSASIWVPSISTTLNMAILVRRGTRQHSLLGHYITSESRRLIALWASTACYTDSFTILPFRGVRQIRWQMAYCSPFEGLLLWLYFLWLMTAHNAGSSEEVVWYCILISKEDKNVREELSIIIE